MSVFRLSQLKISLLFTCEYEDVVRGRELGCKSSDVSFGPIHLTVVDVVVSLLIEYDTPQTVNDDTVTCEDMENDCLALYS